MPETLKVRDFMAADLVTVRPEMLASEAMVLLLEHKISGMPVVDESGKLVGVLSERDCLKTLVDSQYFEMPSPLVRDLMSTDLTTVGANAGILDVAELFLHHRFRRLPVLEDDQLVGQISRRDVLRAIRSLH